MKKSVVPVLLIFLCSIVSAQPNRVVESKISEVTVFLNRAQVTRSFKARLDPGKVNLVVSGLPSALDPQSIQVSGKGSATILGIQHQHNYINEFNIPPALKVLRDSVETYKGRIVQEESARDILNKEEQLLMANQKIGGTDRAITAAELKVMADFYRSRLNDISAQRIKADMRIRKYQERISKISLQIKEQNELYSRNTSEIVIAVSSDNGGSADLELSYICNDAGWTPVYDIRALDTKSPIQLNYKANVFQGTGEDWSNVRLTLSTANPSLGGVRPELYPWFVDFFNPVSRALKGKVAGVAVQSSAPAMAESMEADKEEEFKTVASFTTTVQTSVNTEFSIAIPYTVSSSRKPTLVDIGSHSLKGEFLYSVAPKLDQDAFLVSRITGWEELSLIPGEANVFFEGTFVSKTFIDPGNIKDTLTLSLGRDKRVVVKREKVKDFTSRRTIGSNQRDTYAYAISVRNTRNEPIRLLVEDQVPVSQNSQIEVTLIDAGGAKHKKESGKLEWEIDLQPQASKVLQYKFEVKYPKDQTISNLP